MSEMNHHFDKHEVTISEVKTELFSDRFPVDLYSYLILLYKFN